MEHSDAIVGVPECNVHAEVFFFSLKLFWVPNVTQLAASREIPVGKSHTSVIPC